MMDADVYRARLTGDIVETERDDETQLREARELDEVTQGRRMRSRYPQVSLLGSTSLRCTLCTKFLQRRIKRRLDHMVHPS